MERPTDELFAGQTCNKMIIQCKHDPHNYQIVIKNLKPSQMLASQRNSQILQNKKSKFRKCWWSSDEPLWSWVIACHRNSTRYNVILSIMYLQGTIQYNTVILQGWVQSSWLMRWIQDVNRGQGHLGSSRLLGATINCSIIRKQNDLFQHFFVRFLFSFF